MSGGKSNLYSETSSFAPSGDYSATSYDSYKPGKMSGGKSNLYSETSSFAPSGDYSATSYDSYKPSKMSGGKSNLYSETSYDVSDMYGGGKYTLNSSDYSDTSAFSILQTAAGKASTELFDKSLEKIKKILKLSNSDDDNYLARAYRTAIYSIIKKEADDDVDGKKDLQTALKRAEKMLKMITEESLKNVSQQKLDEIIEFTKNYEKKQDKNKKSSDTSDTSDKSNSSDDDKKKDSKKKDSKKKDSKKKDSKKKDSKK